MTKKKRKEGGITLSTGWTVKVKRVKVEVHSQLANEERAKRAPLKFWLEGGALHDDIAKPPTKARAVKAARSRKSSDQISEGK